MIEALSSCGRATPSRNETNLPELEATRSPGTRIPPKLSGSEAETVTVSPEGAGLPMGNPPFRVVARKKCDGRHAARHHAAFALGQHFQCRGMRREPPPPDRARQTKLIDLFWIVIGDTSREGLAFPGIRRRFKSLQLSQRFEQAALAQQLCARRDMLPTEKPVHELRRSYRLDLLAQLSERKAMDARQQAALAPFRFA